MAFIRLIVFGFLGLSVIYLVISWYMRSTTREALEKHWAEDHPGDEGSAERETYIEEGMEHYRHGLRRRLVLLVYIIPTIAVAVILFIINAN